MVEVHCDKHRTAPAGWRCDGCGGNLCVDCAFVRLVQRTTLDSCGRCGGFARPITAHRSRVSFARRLASVWRFPLGRNGLIALAALGGFMYLADLLGVWGGRLALMAFWAYLFSVIRSTANGSDDISPPEFADITDDLVIPGARGAFATAILWVPLLLYLIHAAHPSSPAPPSLPIAADPVAAAPAADDDPDPEPGPAADDDVDVDVEKSLKNLREQGVQIDRAQAEAIRAAARRAKPHAGGPNGATMEEPASRPPSRWSPARDPIVWLIVFASLLYAPMALLFAAAGSSLVDMINPVNIIGAIAGFGRDYFIAVAALVGIGGFGVMVGLVAALLRALPIPVVPSVIASIAVLYAPFAMARVLGLLLYVRGDRVGYGIVAEYFEPVLRGAAPRGQPFEGRGRAAEVAPAGGAPGPATAHGAATVRSAATATGAATAHGPATATGAATAHGPATATGAATAHGPATATGAAPATAHGTAAAFTPAARPAAIELSADPFAEPDSGDPEHGGGGGPVKD